MKIWKRIATDKWDCVHTLPPIKNGINVFAVLPTGEIIRGGGEARANIQIWKQIKEQWRCIQTLTHEGTENYDLVTFPTGEFATGGFKTIKIWKQVQATWVCTSTFEHHLQAMEGHLAVLPTGELVISRRYRGEAPVRIWKRVEGNWQCVQTLPENSENYNTLVALPTGEIVTSDYHGSVTMEVWSPQSYLSLEKSLPTHTDRLHHNFQMLLRSGWLRAEQVPLLLPKDLKTLNVGEVMLKEDIKQAILAHCPQVNVVGA
jgi:WD40 repeat protein